MDRVAARPGHRSLADAEGFRMPFTPRYEQLNIRLTRREFEYIQRFAYKAGKRPGGWAHDVIRNRILAEIERAAAKARPLSEGRLPEPHSNANTNPEHQQALTGND